MPVVVRGIVPKRTEGEGVLVDVLRLVDQRFHEITRADVVEKVAEEVAAEWVVAKVLDHASAVRVGARVEQFFRRGTGKARQQHLADGVVPERIDVGLVGQHGIRRGGPCHT